MTAVLPSWVVAPARISTVHYWVRDSEWGRFEVKAVQGVGVMHHNKNRQCAPSGPDVKTAARFSRRSGKRDAAATVRKGEVNDKH